MIMVGRNMLQNNRNYLRISQVFVWMVLRFSSGISNNNVTCSLLNSV